MRSFRSYKVRFKVSTVTIILLTSIFILPLFTLIQPTWSQPPWWNDDWSFRKSIVLNHTMVRANLDSFPVLVVDNDVKGAQPDGDDLVFLTESGTILKHEIEYYDSLSGVLVAWVGIPSLSSTEDVTFYMYYGNSEASNQQNRTDVWDSSFAMVQHMAEKSTNRYDSTINLNNGTAYGSISKSASGKIDGADFFDGVDDYVRVLNSGSLNPTSAITIELWMNLSLTSTFINLVSKGDYSQYYLRSGPSEGSTYWYVKFGDGTSKPVEGNIGWKANTWHYVVVTLDTSASVTRVYLDGIEKLNSTFAAGKNLASTTNPILTSDVNQRKVKGNIDEVRISNISRPAAWIETSYNNQKSPTEFCIVGTKENNPNVSSPLIFESPQNEATNIYTNPTLSAQVMDPNGQNMTIVFRERLSNTWIDIATFQNVPDGTYSVNATQMKSLGTTYYWGVSAGYTDNWTNKTFVLTTTPKVITQKWLVAGAPRGVSGVLVADINGDGTEEVIQAGKSGVIALNGATGQTIWNISDSGIGDHAQAQMADLNHDGILEVIVPRETPAGVLVLHANDGSTYWNITGLGKETYSGPVVFDVDGNGYPTIFLGSTDTSKGLDGTGRITALSYDGTILRQVFVWRPCSGGLSIADTDQDGEFELYMGDRYMYLNDPTWGDNDYGKGVQSYWARNLTLRWSRPEVFCSSQKPMIADVNKDGILDIIIGDLNGGLAVLNATDGSTIRMTLGIPNDAPTHYQPSIYDIDGDGNLEMLMADFHNTTSDDLVVWDLVKWQIDARIYLGKCFYGPLVADVNGDGQMEIVACNFKSIFIINRNYQVIDGVVGLSGEVTYPDEVRNIDGLSGLAGTLNYAVAQDIDGDAYNELVVSTQSGSVYAFDTPARRPDPRPRSEVQFYSEYRLGAAEYVQPQGGPAPMISSPIPSDLKTNVPISTSQLQVTLMDYQHDPMNYTVTTNPNIGSGSGTNVNNSEYSVPISGLIPYMTYTWTVNATDGAHSTSRTFTFSTAGFSSWWNIEWPNRRKITINHLKVVSNQSSFPILIDIVDTNLTTKARTDGGDIAFVDANNNKLNHEIESYDYATGHLVTWVNIPELSSIADTEIYMYYGNLAAPDQQNRQATWDANFVMVQHLEENTTSRNDSTVNGNNGAVYNGVSKTTGKIDGSDIFDGLNDYASFPNSPSLNPSSSITIEAWINVSLTGNYINLVSKGGYGQYYLRLGPTAGETYWYVRFNDGTATFVGGNTGWAVNNWHLLTAVLDVPSQTIRVYLDGAQKLSGTFASGKSITATANSIVVSDTILRRLKGSVDEMRISNVARSSTWVQTTYNNQKDSSSFYTLGSEETPGTIEFPVVFASSPPDKATGIPLSLPELSFNLADSQNDLMNYTVTTSPDVGSGAGVNVSSGRFTVPVGGLQYFTMYTWQVSATDGTHWTNMTYKFSTLPSELPTQTDPTLTIDQYGSLTAYNQTTYDPDGDRVTNIYSWYRNGASTTNLLLPFETNSSTTAKDYSGYGNDGLIVRGATWTDNGKIGGAYRLDRGYIQVQGSNTLDGGGSWPEITVEHWIYLTSPQTGTVRTISRIPSYEIGISGNSIFAGIWISPGSPLISGYNRLAYNATLQTNMWYHVALTYKSSIGLTLYLNGVAVANMNVTGNIQPSGFNPLSIGWFDYFKGIIDEVRIYPKSLSPQQILQRYLETKDGSSNSSTVVSQETNTGDTWKCLVTPNDSHQDGTTKSSNTVTIGYNNKPSAKNITINPITPKTNDDLVGNYTYFDPDGDPENGTEIKWYKNDALQPDLNDTPTVSHSLTTKGEIWHFTVTPYDGKEPGETQTSPNVTIQNSPPSITSYYPLTDPDPIYPGESMEFNITCDDPDGDSLTINWYVNDALQEAWTGNTSIIFYADSEGTYIIKVVVSDGQNEASHQWTLNVAPLPP